MKNKIWVAFFVSLLVLSIVSASMLIPLSDRGKEKSGADNSVVIEKSSDGDLALSHPGLEKIVFIHYKKGYGRVCNNDGVCEPELGENPSCADCKKNGEPEEPTSTCYAFLGAKWKDLPVNYVIDPDNSDGLSESFITSAISNGTEEWDANTDADLFGTYSIDYESSWDDKVPDNRNELLFGDYPQKGVIGVTIIWGYFRGRPDNRRIVEFDILFDTDFTWGDATINPEVMDLQNIATHELGHGVGLGDLYDTVCMDVTMYGYSSEGETKKRTLEQPDITGIQTLYS